MKTKIKEFFVDVWKETWVNKKTRGFTIIMGVLLNFIIQSFKYSLTNSLLLMIPLIYGLYFFIKYKDK